MAQHIYAHPMGHKVPSPTGIIGQLDKSGPLTYWAANCACDYILQELEEVKHWAWDPEMTWTYMVEKMFPLIESARKNFRKVSAEALDIGSAVHDAIEKYLKTGKEPQAPSDEVLSGFLAFLEWKDQHKLEPIKTEHTVYDPAGMYAGTLDLLCQLDSKIYVIDFKTSKKPRNNKPYDEWSYQLAAYRQCVTNNSPYEVRGMGIVRLDKETGEPDWYDLSDQYEESLEIFNILVELWYKRNPRYEWRGQ